MLHVIPYKSVTVNVTTIIFLVAPTAAIVPKKSNFILGQALKLVCNAKGYPTPTVYWLRGGKKMVANENIRLTGNELTLHNMHRGDAGLYSCLAQNAAGEFTAIASLHYMGKYEGLLKI